MRRALLTFTVFGALVTSAHAAVAPASGGSTAVVNQNRSSAQPSNTASIQQAVSNAAQSDQCSALVGGAYGTPEMAFTVNFTHNDRNCVNIRKAKELEALNLHYAAVQVMCLDGDVRRAMKRAGTRCEDQVEPTVTEPSR